jgi:hypothetical protein
VLTRPARSIDAYRRAPGVPGARGRVLFAALDTIVDAQIGALETIYAGYSHIQGGGLRGGRFAASASGARLRLHGYELVPGLAISGALRASATEDAGTVTVDGPGHLDGQLRITAKGVVVGTLGGRAVRYDPAKDRSAAAAGVTPAARGRTPGALRLSQLPAALRRVQALQARR